MEKLTGKCKEDFKAYHCNSKNQFKLNNIEFKDLPEIVQNALIIEFFDSVGLYVTVKRNCQGIKFNHWYYIITDIRGMHLNNFLETKIDKDSRREATNESITKLNEIYNSKQ